MILFALCHIFNFMKPLLQPPILFLLLIHLGLRVFAILSNTLLLNVDMSIKKNLASTVVVSLIMIHFGGKCFQNTFKFKYPSTQLTSSVQVILR